MTDSITIEFPCDYPIKIIGVSKPVFRETVVEIVRLHAPNLDEKTISERASKNGTYCAVNLSIVATGEPQLQALHLDLMAEPLVKMVL
ncbi:MAG: DUF493 domain-containing protein [Gammaproteobacteria bacterium]|nr:DUF493 domain-containing protein [Gammaproteobacteria bacterium]